MLGEEERNEKLEDRERIRRGGRLNGRGDKKIKVVKCGGKKWKDKGGG